MNQLTELLTQYGEIPLIIFDGWNWKMGHRLIDFQKIYNHIKKLQPNCLVAEHNGNSPLQTDIIYYEGPKGVYPPGNNNYPSQMALTLTNGWFWHPGAEKQVKSLDYILDKLQRVVPLYCNFMVNIGPNRDGLFDEEVVARLKAVGASWKPDLNRLPLPKQGEALKTYLRAKDIEASAGQVFIEPAGSADDGSPVAELLAQKTASVMIDGISDIVGDRGGFAAFQTYWKFFSKENNSLVLDLGTSENFSKFYYLPVQLKGYTGLITKYELSVSDDNQNFKPVKTDNWNKTTDLKTASFSPVKARYIKLKILSSIAEAMVSEVGVGN